MDRNMCIKYMTKFYNVCGTFPINIQIIFFNGYDIQFDDRVPIQMKRKNNPTLCT